MRKEKVFIYVASDVIEGYINWPDAADASTEAADASPAASTGAAASGPLPAVIFTNGWGAYHEMYEEMAERFCNAGYVTLQYETRGSAGPRREFQLCGTEWKDDINAAISYMWGCANVDRARIGLAGVSMGGAMTLIQGAVDPRVKALYAMAPYINGEIGEHQRYLREASEERWQEFLQLCFEDAAARAHGYEGAKPELNYSFMTDSYFEPDEKLKEVRRKYPLAMTREPYESTWNVYLYVDALDAVRKIRIPTMIVHGTGDTLLRYQDSEMLYENLAAPQKEFHLIEGAQHELPLCATEESTKYGLEWFGKYL